MSCVGCLWVVRPRLPTVRVRRQIAAYRGTHSLLFGALVMSDLSFRMNGCQPVHLCSKKVTFSLNIEPSGLDFEEEARCDAYHKQSPV
jgi:hypothetical protein